ncbi:rhodanese-like domain-containing protein [Acidiplasma cupricumulans]|uniref:rhodanese-like domain-containing protein n=1 Tax=Acidiplasma cupricumulans TaxID=312540 RepID=UPI001584BE3E|nr:rhodanese-like domain-containing protein [Acidiplasma cupricumulans]
MKRFRGELDNVEFIDLRSGSDYENWHEPGAINLNLGELRNFIEHADRFKNYVFYCKKGLNSAYAASIMSKHGFNAYYVSERDLKSMQKLIKFIFNIFLVSNGSEHIHIPPILHCEIIYFP